MARKNTETEIEPKTFLETVNGKIPNKDVKRLTAIRDSLFAFKQEFAEAKLHNYPLRETVYFRWKDELEAMQRMFDSP